MGGGPSGGAPWPAITPSGGGPIRGAPCADVPMLVIIGGGGANPLTGVPIIGGILCGAAPWPGIAPGDIMGGTGPLYGELLRGAIGDIPAVAKLMGGVLVGRGPGGRVPL